MSRHLAYSPYFWVIYILFINIYLINSKPTNKNDYIDPRQILYQEAIAAKLMYPGLFNGNAKKALRIFGKLIADNSTDHIAKKSGLQLGEWYILGVPRFLPFRKRYEYNIDKAIHYLSLASRLGDPRSNYLLSFIYQIMSLNEFNPFDNGLNNNKISKCPDKSLDYFKSNSNSMSKKDDKLQLMLKHLQIAAELGDVMALSTVGYNLLCNSTLDKKTNPKLSSKYYKKAVQLIISGKDGITPAYIIESQLPVTILTDENIHLVPQYGSIDLESSMDYWQSKAMQGDALAQYELAKLHNDDKQAEELLSMAANKSHAPALRDLALVYLSRNNIEMAIKLLQKAADLGDADAAAILAYILLRDDMGVKKLDTSKPKVQMGIKYLIMACKQNVPDALFLLGEILSFMGNFREAKWLYERSADAGFIQSIWVIAHYHHSRGDYKKYSYDLKLIADSSPSITKYINLGFKYLSEANYIGSLMCFLIAAYQGSLLSQLNAAYLCKYLKMNKIKIDLNLDNIEFYLLIQSVMQGSNYPLYHIANIINNVDTNKAFHLYKRSFLFGDSRSILPLVKQYHQNGEIDKAIELLEFYTKTLDRKKFSFIGDFIKDSRHVLYHYYNRYKISVLLKIMKIKKKVELLLRKN